MTWNLIGQAAVICLILSITALFNSRIYWLVKIKKEDPLRAIQPWWVKDEEDRILNEEFIGRG